MDEPLDAVPVQVSLHHNVRALVPSGYFHVDAVHGHAFFRLFYDGRRTTWFPGSPCPACHFTALLNNESEFPAHFNVLAVRSHADLPIASRMHDIGGFPLTDRPLRSCQQAAEVSCRSCGCNCEMRSEKHAAPLKFVPLVVQFSPINWSTN